MVTLWDRVFTKFNVSKLVQEACEATEDGPVDLRDGGRRPIKTREKTRTCIEDS